ncbi:hypothetical protein DSM112329_03211 [Paraconexibacter sp. AEG42_29]|uniref:Transposase IS4-like domain-containing protein n=1 Tax=Paraconexibacter sp. AEG42_29 TaxID=2997339 RepID=A0AAU7AXI8_9ACTN
MPARLTGAIDNSLSRWQDLLDVIEAHPLLWDGLSSADLLVKKEGRPRMGGEWPLAFLLYANSGERELRRWHRSTADELWQRIGFAAMPGYDATYKNFRELEAHEAAFRLVASRLIQLAVEKSGGKVGHAVHVDGTEAETNSRLIHDCTDGDACSKQAKVPRRLGSADARDERHRLAEQLPTDDVLMGAADGVEEGDRGLRVKVGGCWYLLSDDEAGIRAYVRADGKVRKFWAGYYCLKATDHYTGGVIGAHFTDASTQEHLGYPALYEQVKENIGQAPKAVVADRGFSISSVFELHTRDGVASVMPWRKHHYELNRDDHERFDRHGIPRCKHCNGETVYQRFQHDAGPSSRPRLWFLCARPVEEGCERSQSIMCSENWRLLLPLWRTSPAYQVLREKHQSYEASHHRWRERYAVAGDCKADRIKRRGLGVQQLRASAALVIEWLTICHREGWLGGPRINTRSETVVRRGEARAYCDRLVAVRQALGLSSVDSADLAEHQAEVLGAYGSSASGLGPGSAHGPGISALLEPGAAVPDAPTAAADPSPTEGSDDPPGP